MVAQDLISRDISPLRTDQTGKDALALLSEHHVRHLPVTEDNRLVGLVSEEDVFNHKLHDKVGSFALSPRHVTALATDHVFDVMRVMGENRLTVIPVIDLEGIYLGLISQTDLMRFFAETTAFTEPGSVLVLEMNKRDYSLALIARLVESENAAILSAVITSKLDSPLIELTIKTNQPEVARIATALERHGISIRESFSENEYQDGMKDRYDSFMSWMNV